jgi:hypothetical protein
LISSAGLVIVGHVLTYERGERDCGVDSPVCVLASDLVGAIGRYDPLHDGIGDNVDHSVPAVSATASVASASDASARPSTSASTLVVPHHQRRCQEHQQHDQSRWTRPHQQRQHTESELAHDQRAPIPGDPLRQALLR